MPTFDTTALLSRTRLKAVLDGTESDYPDAVLLDLCDGVLVEEIVPLILARDSDYYLIYQDISVTSGRHEYPIPSRAFAAKIHSCYYLNSAKTACDLLGYTDQRMIGLHSNGVPIDHTIKDNHIVLGNIPTTAAYLRIYYPYRPNNLVAASACMQVTSRTAGLLAGSPPAGWTTDDTFDIVSANTPFELIGASLTASSVSGGVTFTESDLNTDRLDDGGTYFVTLERETCYPMVPEEFHRLIADLASCPVLQNHGDEGWSTRYKTSHLKLENLVNALIHRKETEDKPVINSFSYFYHFR